MMAYSGKDSRYLAGRLATQGQEIYIALMVGKNRTQLDMIELVPMDTGLVVLHAEALASSIAQAGHVEVPGIYFDTGKAL